MSAFFITSTDTDAGKTAISSMLLHAARVHNKKSLGFKPIASGIEEVDGQKINKDVELIKTSSSVVIPYRVINPYLFEAAIAPHIAAQKSNQTINVNLICKQINSYSHLADFIIVEGVGGWEVPLNPLQGIPDLAKSLAMPIIIIVKIKTGCINHALLTINAIRNKGLIIAGWIANQVMEGDVAQKNISTIEEHSGLPCLAQIPFYRSFSFKEQINRCQSNDVNKEIRDLFFLLSELK